MKNCKENGIVVEMDTHDGQETRIGSVELLKRRVQIIGLKKYFLTNVALNYLEFRKHFKLTIAVVTVMLLILNSNIAESFQRIST